jgi:hypothetical protein
MHLQGFLEMLLTAFYLLVALSFFTFLAKIRWCASNCLHLNPKEDIRFIKRLRETETHFVTQTNMKIRDSVIKQRAGKEQANIHHDEIKANRSDG